MRGEVVYYFVYDLGARVNLDLVKRVLDEVPEFPAVSVQKAAPRYVELPRPLVARFDPIELESTIGPLRVEAVAKVFDIGAVSLQFRVPFQEAGLQDLHKYLNLQVVVNGDKLSLLDYAARFFHPIREGLTGALIEKYFVRSEPEEYTAICVNESDYTPKDLLKEHRPRLSALLANEPRADKLSQHEVEDNLKFWYTYYDDDLVVVDWDYAFVLDKERKYEDALFVMELANVQLLELRTYDAYLDRILEKSYTDLERFVTGKGLFASPSALMKELSDARIDLTRVADSIENIGKLFGDYYLAKIYLALTHRFHIPQWERAVNEKLRTLHELYGMASHEVQARRGLTLEVLIVLLFIIDLAILAVTLR
ncbi:MAG: hypothetical protein LC624_02500 [Halobacteriales archaeon]|nr:hypothetical protein [Halobacteriales archaeon]